MAEYKRRVILINRRFQIRFAIFVCSWIFALSLVYPLIITTLFDTFARYMALDPNGPPIAALQETRHKVVTWVVVLHFLFMIGIFLISIFISHRIAGPLYKLNMFFKSARDGNLREKLFFRKSDHFRELATSYNEMLDSIRDARGRAVVHMEKALGSSSGEIRSELEKALAALREERT